MILGQAPGLRCPHSSPGIKLTSNLNQVQAGWEKKKP
jgi:hypothetical protein